MPHGTFLGLPRGAKIHELCKRADKIIEESWLAVGIHLYPPKYHKCTNAQMRGYCKEFISLSTHVRPKQAKKVCHHEESMINVSSSKRNLVQMRIKSITHMELKGFETLFVRIFIFWLHIFFFMVCIHRHSHMNI